MLDETRRETAAGPGGTESATLARVPARSVPVAGSQPGTSTPKRDGCGCALMWVLLLGMIPVTILLQVLGWALVPLGLSMFMSLSDGSVMALSSLLQGVLLGIPLWFLGLLWRGPRYRAVFRVWLAAVGYLLVMAPTRYLLPTAAQMGLCLQIVVTAAYLAFVLFITRGWMEGAASSARQRSSRAAILLAVTLAAPFAYPWLVWGALGSPLDIVLGLVWSAFFGMLAATIVARFWLGSLPRDSRGLGWDILTGGLVIGGALFIMGSGAGFNGSHVLLLLYFPALGWLAMGLSLLESGGRPAGNWLALAVFIGLVAAFPVLFLDPDVVYFPFVTAGGEMLFLALKAAGLSVCLAWLLGVLVFLFRRRLGSAWSGSWLVGTAVVLWAVGVLIYGAFGQVGFHGDRLFVVLHDQADVSAAAALADYDQRRASVYQQLVDHANTTQADLRAALDALHVHYTPYYLVNALEVEGGLLHRLWLSNRPEVARIMPSPVLRPLPAAPLPGTGDSAPPPEPQWNLTHIGADRVWSELGVRGAGIVVGQSDSGVQADHPELADSYRGRTGTHDYNWFDPWFGTAAPQDFGGHGTHTLGSVLGDTVGVAPDAQWYACANLARNLGSPAKYLDCMQFMLAPFPVGGDPFADGDPARSAHVINNSWGCPEDREGCDPESLHPAVTALRAAGIFVVASAGNEGPLCSTVKDPIAIYEDAFSVGAIDAAGNLGEFSSTGPVTVDGSGRIKPDIVAPGVDVLSATPGDTYGTASGTSMAGPHVAGVVALLWAANPALIGDIARTEQILIETARPYTGTTDIFQSAAVTAGTSASDLPFAFGTCLEETDLSIVPNNVVGYGVVDAYAAVERALAEKNEP